MQEAAKLGVFIEFDYRNTEGVRMDAIRKVGPQSASFRILTKVSAPKEYGGLMASAPLRRRCAPTASRTRSRPDVQGEPGERWGWQRRRFHQGHDRQVVALVPEYLCTPGRTHSNGCDGSVAALPD
jgi:hypothetical protein